ncbi:MAG: hypothetical protein JWM34_10 [Ilumatobacteraceae bacterium]|nr:hypothetical protein [Ilumatobacteraceae bacterium]
MSSDHVSADATGAEPDQGPFAGLPPSPPDELRERMKLRLASQTATRQDAERSGIHELVWNSVLESVSLGAPMAEASRSPLLLAPFSASALQSTPAAAPPVQQPVIEAPIVAAGAPIVEPLIVETPVAETPVADTPVAEIPAAPVGVPIIVEPAVEPVELVVPEPQLPGLAAVRPAEVPPADLIDFGPIVPSMPVLAPRSRVAPTPRPVQLVDDEPHVPPARGNRRAAKPKAAPRRAPAARPLHGKPARHPFRSFVSFVLLLGLLGGAGYAGWYHFLRKRVEWSKDLQPTVDFVQSTVHRTFDANVPVVTLTAPEYEVKLGLEALDRLDPADATLDLLDYRAVGLLSGPPRAADVGHLLAPSTTAFYDGATRSVYRLDGTTPAFQLDLTRALTLALVDQDVHFTQAMPTLSTSQRDGYWSLIDGIAARVVAAQRTARPDLGTAEATEVPTRFVAAGISTDLPWYLSGIVGAADAASPADTSSPDDLLRGLMPPPTDAVVFDPSAAASPTTAAPSPSPSPAPTAGELGVEFWYEALAPVIGVDAARAAALLWISDTSTTTAVNGQACLQSTIDAADAAGQNGLLDALGAWARSRPASSAASAAPAADGSFAVSVTACEPPEGGEAPHAPLTDMQTFFDRPAEERAVLGRVIELAAPGASVDPRCVVAAYRNGAIGQFDLSSTDPAIVTTLSNVAAFCKGS